MLKKVLLPTILAILAYGFWYSPDFKEIAAGVSIFLFGMLSLEEGFRAFTGGILERILNRTTDKLWKSLSFGIVATTLMQSSSLVSVITISFLSAGLLGLSEGIGIVFGANLGTTTGAWLVAGFGLKVKISAYAMPMLVFGIILVFQRAQSLKGIGYILAGLGFLFLGIHHMKEGFEAFKATIDLSQFAVSGYAGLFIFSFIGLFATVVMQSSHATLVLIITALSAGQITYENALALAIGANVGTTITAIIGAMSANEQGRRLAGAHLIFNVTTGLLAIIFVHQFIWAVDRVSTLVGIAADDYTLKLAVFHTIFNLVGVLVMIPFIGKLVTFLVSLVKEKERDVAAPRYLDSANVDFPDTAVQAVRNETLHIYQNARDLIAQALNFDPSDLLNSDTSLTEKVAAQTKMEEVDIDDIYARRIKNLYSAVVAFISHATFSWEKEQSGNLHWLRDANRNIVEAVKGVEQLQENMLTFVSSNIPPMRNRYNQIRVNIGRALQELEGCRNSTDPSMAVLTLDRLKLAWEEDNREFSRELFAMIRERKITPEMGTSLMNDNAYAHGVVNNLIAMATTLFVFRTSGAGNVESALALSDKEVRQATT